MKSELEPDALTESNEPHDLTHSTTLKDIPGITAEEKQAWLREMKMEYSRPRKHWTAEEIQRAFPNGKWQEDPFKIEQGSIKQIFRTRGAAKVFIGEDPQFETMAHLKDKMQFDSNGNLVTPPNPITIVPARRIFNQQGFEIERHKYRSILLSEKLHPFDMNWRTLSEYDEQGYLVRFMHLEIGMIGLIRTAEYDTLADGSKQLTKWVTQPVLRESGAMQPGLPYGEPVVIDFSNVPIK